MARAFEELFGIADAFRRIPMPGRTDAWILADALAAHGVTAHDARVADFPRTYLRHLTSEIREPGPRKGVMPGVRPLLDALRAHPDVHLALLTGNFEAAARVKLEYFELWDYFPCGAFGDDARERNGLLPKAIARVAACGGPRVEPRATVVIGDTPLDIGVAKSGGARSIGVATGGSSADDLRASGADVVFEDLADTKAVLEALGIESTFVRS